MFEGKTINLAKDVIQNVKNVNNIGKGVPDLVQFYVEGSIWR